MWPLGESIAINSKCLTVVAGCSEACSFEVSPETLRRTNLGELQRGSPVNLEEASAAGPIGWAAISSKGTSTEWGGLPPDGPTATGRFSGSAAAGQSHRCPNGEQ